MDTENKQIQQRHGTYEKFQQDKANILPHTFSSVTSGDPIGSDGTGLYFSFMAGKSERMITYKEAQQMVDIAIQELRRELRLG